MKRAPFLTAAGTALLAGCGSHGVLRSIIPGASSVAGGSAAVAPSGAVRLVPEAADPIPADVLANPFMAEARRFDGAAAPAGWLLMKGQSLSISENQGLYAILGGNLGSGKGTFKLPNLSFGMIVSVAGAVPNSPQFLSASKRVPTAIASLGPGAVARPPTMPKPPSQDQLAAQRLIASQIRASSRSQPLSSEVRAQISQATQSARDAALARLSPQNQTRLGAAIDAAVSGQTDVFGAVRQMAPALSQAEAAALLDVNDGMTRPFNDRWTGSRRSNLQMDAAQFLVSVAFTREQTRALANRERRTL